MSRKIVTIDANELRRGGAVCLLLTSKAGTADTPGPWAAFAETPGRG